MSCYGCKCNFCANSVELGPPYWTPGECDFSCFTCDECKWYDGDMKKRSQWRGECPHFKEPAKRIQIHREAAEREAQRRRRLIHFVK